jgi:hypothetical protein
LIDARLAVVLEVHTPEDEEAVGGARTLPSVREEAVGPARDRRVSEHSEGDPLGGVNVEHANVIESYVIGASENLVISTAIDN